MRRLPVVLMLLLFTLPAWAGVEVAIHGLGSDEQHNVQVQLGLLAYAKSLEGNTPDAAEVERLNAQAPADIRRALQPFGWYSPTIKSALKRHGDDWSADYTVNAGSQTDVSGIDIQLTGDGAKLPALVRDTHHRWPLKKGERLKHQNYEAVKQRLLDQAHSLGYLSAHYTRHVLRVNPPARTAQVLLTLETGPRYYFGTVTVEQDHPRLQERVIRRYLTVVSGQPFESGQVLSSQFALNDLGYFSNVSVEPQRDKVSKDHHIPVLVRVSYAKPRVYRLGAGYGTDTGARALAGIQFRRLNSRGHSLSLDLRPSQNISTAIADYRIPIGSVPGQMFDVTAEGLQQNFQGIDERLYSLSLARIQLKGAWQKRYYLTYADDHYTIGGEPQRYSTLLTPGINFSHTSVDNAIYPSHGWYAFLDLHGATSADQLSNVNFLSAHLKLRGVVPITRRLRLLARAEEAALVTSRFDRLPPSQRFFAGGADSVRGYSYQSLAPLNAFGRVAGGKYLTTGSLELDWDVWRPYGLAAFVDAGGADDVPNVRLHFGAGIGFRYLAPFGAIAIDIAHPFDRGASLVRLHLGVRVGL